MRRFIYSLPVAIVMLGGAVAVAFIIFSVRTLLGIKPPEPEL